MLASSRSSASYRTSREWLAYFQANSERLWPIPWQPRAGLSRSERDLIASSLQTFQLGESGTGRHLFRAAEAYAARTGDRDYPQALKLFITEEHRHASDLGRVLDLAGIPRIREHWSDNVFRFLRHPLGLEEILCLLLTAELIAKVYYAALRQATAGPALRRLCEQILRDEGAHVRFQCERLGMLRENRAGWLRAVSLAAQRAFLLATCGAFWISHSRVMRAGGYDWKRFIRRARNEFAAAARVIEANRIRAAVASMGRIPAEEAV